MWGIHRALCNGIVFQSVRKFGSFNFFDASVDANKIATLSMKRPPVNSMSLEFFEEFSDVMDGLENRKVRGMILTSSNKKVFSAGLDLNELVAANEERFRKFYTGLQNLWIKLYGSSFVTAAAVNGHAIAGGCLIPLSCDYSVMVKDFSIGLNETAVGLLVPTWLETTMSHLIGKRKAEVAIMSGKIFTTQEAFNIGMIDETAVDKADALRKAEEFMKRFEQLPLLTLAAEKQKLRRPYIEELLKHRDEDFQLFYSQIMQPEIQNHVKTYLSSLKNKKKTQN